MKYPGEMNPTDHTSPAAREVQAELLRQATPARRLALVRSLSQTVIELSRRAIGRRWPELDETGVALKWVEYHYGKDLARRLTAYCDDGPEKNEI